MFVPESSRTLLVHEVSAVGVCEVGGLPCMTKPGVHRSMLELLSSKVSLEELMLGQLQTAARSTESILEPAFAISKRSILLS